MPFLLLLFTFVLLISNSVLGQDRWVAPSEADTLENIYSLNDADIIAHGQSLYITVCASCHGERGDGGGGAGQTFNQHPTDFTREDVQEQSDGALFWKIKKGNPPGMISYENVLSEEEVWQIVTYLRKFTKN